MRLTGMHGREGWEDMASQPLVSPDAPAPPEGAPEDRKQVVKLMT